MQKKKLTENNKIWFSFFVAQYPKKKKKIEKMGGSRFFLFLFLFLLFFLSLAAGGYGAAGVCMGKPVFVKVIQR